MLTNKFLYCPDTGLITRLVRQGNYPVGSVVGGLRANGYLYTKVSGKQVLVHRLAWLLHTGDQPPAQIDHINMDKSDNRWANLREATPSTNQMNISVHARSTTRVKGIFPVRGGKLYRAEVCLNGVRHQKHSTSIIKLEDWVNVKRQELHKEYARA